MPNFQRRTREWLKRSLHTVFAQGQRLGVDILPRHFYSEVPNLTVLRHEQEWKAPFSMAGVAGIDLQMQLEFVERCCNTSILQRLANGKVLTDAHARNGAEGYGAIEADFLFAYVASQKPATIFQIGCGVSTAICLAAAEFAGYRLKLICIEPYPTAFLEEADRSGAITLVREKAQAIDTARIDALDSDLLFFVDSSHTLGPAGEVSRVVLEMLPRLKAGATIHFHDIFFPYDYARDVLSSTLFFWHESVLIHAFLAYNTRFSILVAFSMLHYGRPTQLQNILTNYRPQQNDEGLAVGDGHFPSSLYLRVG